MPTPWLAFSIDRSSRTPVFEQICQELRKEIISGRLETGAKLPPTRSLAIELGVSRSTLVTAYDQLVAEGYIEGRQGAGFVICGMQSVEIRTALHPQTYDDQPPIEPVRALAAGNPDMRLFPHRAWSKTVARVGRQKPDEMLVSTSVQGHIKLRKAIAEHVHEWRGVSAQPQQIFVTAGSIEALELCFRAVSAPGGSVALENPGYLPMRRQVIAQGLRPVYTAMDSQGALLPPEPAELAVLTPSHQYPLGGTMSPARRQSYLAWAREAGSWIVEDDYDSEFRFAGSPIPAMAGFDRLERTIYVGSFSKVFSSGLRLGYAIVPFPLREQFTKVLERFGSKASVMPQLPLAEFMLSGEFYRHLRRARRQYAKRRDYLMERLKADFAEFGTFEDHQAGMQLAFMLHGHIPDEIAAAEAEAAGLSISALSRFYTQEATGNGLLLGYCGDTPEEMEPALDQLHRILSDLSKSGSAQ